MEIVKFLGNLAAPDVIQWRAVRGDAAEHPNLIVEDRAGMPHPGREWILLIHFPLFPDHLCTLLVLLVIRTYAIRVRALWIRRTAADQPQRIIVDHSGTFTHVRREILLRLHTPVVDP